jgi:hypothetical protein
LFYATFPAARLARDAAYNAASEQSTYDPHKPVDCLTLHEATQPLEYDIRNELDISRTSASFRARQESSYLQLHTAAAYSEGLHPQILSHHQSQPSYNSSSPVSFFYILFV